MHKSVFKIKIYLNESVSGITSAQHSIFNGVIIGVIVGFSIATYDWIITDILIKKTKLLPLSLIGIAPFFAMLLTGIIVWLYKINKTSMADEVVYAFHTKAENLEIQTAFPKLLSSIATVGLGGSAGLEGSSKWVGAVVGLFSQHLINSCRFLKKIEGSLSVAMMTGASAGIAAIFKAPLSGTIMALESPYKKDMAHEPLVQSFLGAVTSYAIYTSIRGSQKFFIISLNYRLRWEDILISALIGLVTGLFSTTFLKALKKSRNILVNKKNIIGRYVAGGALLTIIAYVGLYMFGHYVSLYGGNDIIVNIFNNQYNATESIIIALLKALATIVTFAFGGIGGLFLPSATIGACLGQIFQYIFHFATPGILPFIGVASFIAASYNGLLFGPVLIAEISGEPSLVVLGIVASTLAYIVSNGVSNSAHQKDHR